MSVSVVYRYYKADAHDHFYTTNASEIGTTTSGQTGNHGYTSEGEAFTVFNHHHAGLNPVYRYYQDNNHDHFYTANASEIGTTTVGQAGNHGYKCEGILGYVSPVEFLGSVAIHRYYHDSHHDHFYTVKAEEIGTTHVGQAGNHGYKYEGVVGYAYPAQHNVLPVYRYYHDAHHDHFYTANASEIGTTQVGQTGNHGYKCEGISFYLYTQHLHGTVPVHRYYHDANHDHFYTANVGEIGTTQVGHAGNHGYKYEGVLGYVSPTGFYGGIPVYRYYHDANHDHFYTSNASEIGTTQVGQAGNHGYKCEGILGYVPHQ